MRTLQTIRGWAVLVLVSQNLNFNSFAQIPAREMAEAAGNFLAALDEEQRRKASFEFQEAERVNWHFIPRARQGLAMKEMRPDQRLLAHAFLNSAMSQKGYMQATTIMSLEKILHDMENQAPHRDAELYYFSVFGKPSVEGTWGWRVEGHHLSLNFTVVKGEHVSVTPSFFGTNPAEVRSGPRQGLRVLAAEEDLARKLVQSLDEEQKKVAIYTDIAPRDIITGADRKATFLEPAGLPMSRMNPEQAQLLVAVLKEYAGRYRSELAEADLNKIRRSGPEKIFFAWAGSVEVGKGHYYRVQGPTFLMEYDNTQNNANHVHAVWRDLENDFGDDILRRHHQEQAHD
jgi:hypothetical protein